MTIIDMVGPSLWVDIWAWMVYTGIYMKSMYG